MHSYTRVVRVLEAMVAGLVVGGVAKQLPAEGPGSLAYRGVQHAADGRLATDLTLAKGATFSATIAFPEAARLGVRKTWACWVFPEDTWGIEGDSEIELYVEETKVTHFAVARGEWKVLIQSLAEHITDHVGDATRPYRITLRNVGRHDVFIRELWIRWLAVAAD